MNSKIIKLIKKPRLIIFQFGIRGLIRVFSDEFYLKMMYWARFGRKLDLDNPNTYNEKIQWLKIHNRKPEFSKMVDKYEAKKYVEDVLGIDLCVPTIAVYDNWNDINTDKLPDSFVIKCTHDSHSVFVCKNKNEFDFNYAKHLITRSLKKNYYWIGREFPYKNVKPRIIVEQYLEDKSTSSLLDYKFYMFNGQFKLLSITARKGKHNVYINYYDDEFNEVDLCWGYPRSNDVYIKPKQYDFMISVAQRLSMNIPFLRVDFYEVDGKAYLGEMTFFDGSGFDEISPDYWDNRMGAWLSLDI